MLIFIPGLVYLFTTLFLIIFRSKFLIFITLILFLAYFGALNISKISLDYEVYNSYFNSLSNISFIEVLSYPDPLFWLFAKFFNFIFGGEDFFNYFFIIFLSVFLKIFIANNNVEKFLIPIFLYLIFSRYLILHDYTQIRASIAIGINTLIFLDFINKGKISKFNVFLLISTCFIHFSSVVFLPLYFIYNRISSDKSLLFLLYLLIVSIIFGQFFSSIFQTLLEYFSWLNRLNVYLGSSSEGADQIKAYSIFQFYFLFKSFVLLLLFKGYKSFSKTDRILTSIFIIAMCIQAAFVFNSAIGLRLASLFGYIDILVFLFPLKYKFYNKIHQIYYLLLLLVGGVFMYSSFNLIENI
ncbi:MULTISPECIES: EpsG family protein [Acinetobacter]|uniref:Wzy n=2 Tax=Acinetobacter TaxID=469 RepID=A0A481WW95_ACIBA|nr:EpsG family protein [Acinetobacter baumannii]EJB8413272.1 EpsG family protein [Acinetobacter baumannii]MCZ3051452.1 EpsG family protein [Acinetobacter baumannii]MCZ3193849.1 EpsG family protein [Acinetobacter baumannii]MCZ3284206.1 EpsG family protein [Acinetobacter baumannii]MDA3594927.1 EpsG family protein [Acinetobacter baumannii]